MKEFKVEIPMAGVYSYRGLFPDDTTEREAIAIVIAQYNDGRGNTKLYQKMLSGAGVEFPLTFAKVVK